MDALDPVPAQTFSKYLCETHIHRSALRQRCCIVLHRHLEEASEKALSFIRGLCDAESVPVMLLSDELDADIRTLSELRHPITDDSASAALARVKRQVPLAQPFVAVVAPKLLADDEAVADTAGTPAAVIVDFVATCFGRCCRRTRAAVPPVRDNSDINVTAPSPAAPAPIQSVEMKARKVQILAFCHRYKVIKRFSDYVVLELQRCFPLTLMQKVQEILR